MAFELKDGQGSLFKNDKEGGNPNWPDYKGTCKIDGKLLYISAWIKDGAKGKFMSLSIQPPREKDEGARTVNRSKPAGKVGDDFDSEVPF